MTHDFYENGERLLKDTRADVALAHARIERMRSLHGIAVVGILILVVAQWAWLAGMSREWNSRHEAAACRCQRAETVSDVRFVEWSER